MNQLVFLTVLLVIFGFNTNGDKWHELSDNKLQLKDGYIEFVSENDIDSIFVDGVNLHIPQKAKVHLILSNFELNQYEIFMEGEPIHLRNGRDSLKYSVNGETGRALPYKKGEERIFFNVIGFFQKEIAILNVPRHQSTTNAEFRFHIDVNNEVSNVDIECDSESLTNQIEKVIKKLALNTDFQKSNNNRISNPNFRINVMRYFYDSENEQIIYGIKEIPNSEIYCYQIE